MKLRIILACILIAAAVAACDRAAVVEPTVTTAPVKELPTQPSEGARVGESFTVGAGDSIWIEKGLFKITLDGVLEDSRCPADVQCFWEGNVKVEVSVDGQVHVLTLGGMMEGDVNAVPLGDGLILRLVNVAPYPGEGNSNTPHQVTLVVERETSQPYNYPQGV